MVLEATQYAIIKNGIIAMFLLLSVNSWSQKLKVNEFDKSANKWRMETFPVSLKSVDNTKMEIVIKSSDTSLLVELMGSGIGTNTLDANSELVFSLENDSTVIAISPSIQSIEYGELLPTYKHQYVLSFDKLQALSRNNLKSVRKYSVGGFDDIAIEKKNAVKLKDLSSFYVAEMKKGKLIPEKAISMPAGFPGGEDVLVSFLNRNLKPALDIKLGEKKMGVVQFTVMADGNVNDLSMKQSAGESFDSELLRILRRMPKWKPAVQNGRAVNSTVIYPVTFYRTDFALKIQLGK